MMYLLRLSGRMYTTMMAFAKRNILLYFRDKTSVFFSLLAVLILIGLYVFFLGDVTANQLPVFPSKKALLMSWFIAGIIGVTSMTTTLASFGILVEDRANKKYLDFYSSPISRAKLVGGYIFSALFVGVIMCVITLGVSFIILLIQGAPAFSFIKMVEAIGLIILGVLASSSMVLFLVSFFKTSNAFAAASTIVGTLLGFLAGIYIPIGSLPDYLQTVVKFFPVSHTTALFRQLLMEPFLIDAFSKATVEMKDAFQYDMGVLYEFNGKQASKFFSVFYLIGTTVLFYALSMLMLSKKDR